MVPKDPLSADDIPEQAGGGATGDGVDWTNPRVAALLDAATALFARKGFAGATLAELGTQVGLRKSIVHYYFESKAALIHEVQRFAYHKYLDVVRATLNVKGGSTMERMANALSSLWTVRRDRWATTALNIELWSATRRDPELKRRAAELQKESRALITHVMREVLQSDAQSVESIDAVSSLILAVLNGLAISEYVEENEEQTQRAYDTFTYLLHLAIQNLGANAGRQSP